MRDLLQDAEFYRTHGEIQRRKTMGLCGAVDNQDAMVPPTGIIAFRWTGPRRATSVVGPRRWRKRKTRRRGDTCSRNACR